MDIVLGIVLGAAATAIVLFGLYVTRSTPSAGGDRPSGTSQSDQHPSSDQNELKR